MICKKLNLDTFKTVVASTPLISIDLIVRNSQGEVLLGKRQNRPAQGSWFVPGGRIFKGEHLKDAFTRIAMIELGNEVTLTDASFIGVFEHHYLDNFLGTDFSTHYIVLGYQINMDIPIDDLPIEQHEKYRWWSIESLLKSAKVHCNTQAYFYNS